MVWTLHPLEAHNLRKAHTISQRDTTTCRASQCRTRMATVVFEDPIHHISGKISKKYRTTYNYRKRSDRKYTSVPGERITPYSQDEMAHQEKFKAVAASTRLRMKDPGKVMQDQAAFKEQSKYKTFYRYVFNLEWESYEG